MERDDDRDTPHSGDEHRPEPFGREVHVDNIRVAPDDAPIALG